MILQENIEIFGKKIRVNNDNFSPIAELWGDVMVDKPAGDILQYIVIMPVIIRGTMIYW